MCPARRCVVFCLNTNIACMKACVADADAVPLRALARRLRAAFTLVEVMVVTALLTALIIGVAAAVSTGNSTSRRLSEYTAALAVVEAKMNDIRIATYNPPNSPFGAAAMTFTGTSSIDLDQSGSQFTVNGTVTTTTTPVTAGHLVTVTGTFQTRRIPITVTLQSVVNKFSAGQQ